MKLSTRLLLPLLATVVVVMVAYGWWAREQREAVVIAESRQEVVAYARVLALALERAAVTPDAGGVQEIIDRISREPAVYAVLIYDPSGRPVFVSDAVEGEPSGPGGILERVMASGEPATVDRDLGGEEVVSVVRPLRNDRGEVLGAPEVAQPLSLVAGELVRVRQRFVLNTLTLVAALGLVLTLLVRRTVSAPLQRFVEAVRVFGGGDLSYRLEAGTAAGELSEVAIELNRMAARLEEARAELIERSGRQIELERKLRRTEKMAAVGRLSAGLAHEIGAPLHVIRGRAERLQGREPSPEVLERNLEIIVGQIDRITLIVRNLTEYARRRPPRRVASDLVDVVAGVAEFLEGEAARVGARFEIVAPEAGVPATVDPDLMHQVFLNLALNALHAVEGGVGGVGGEEGEGGVVTIEVRATAGGGAEADVSDTGPGVPRDVRDRIFDPFFTTKAGSRGTGLGLAVARSVVEEHGGSVDLVEGTADGARFRVVLPPAGARARDPDAGPAPGRRVLAGGGGGHA